MVALRYTVATIKTGGKLVIDYMNTNHTIWRLVSKEEKEVAGILFCIARKVEKGYMVKTISVTNRRQLHPFYEKVRALTYEHFIAYFRMTSLPLVNVFGSSNLERYHPQTSERLVFVLKK